MCHVSPPCLHVVGFVDVSNRRVRLPYVCGWRPISVCRHMAYVVEIFSFVGSCACWQQPRPLQTNSSWTRGHIETLWRHPQTHLVYPPCDTKSIEEFALPLHARRRPCILSVGQFRPEKDHKLQLAAWSTLLQQHPEHQGRAQLVLIGGCRTARDEALLLELRALAASLGLVEGKDILLLPNEPFPSVCSHPHLPHPLPQSRLGLL